MPSLESSLCARSFAEGTEKLTKELGIVRYFIHYGSGLKGDNSIFYFILSWGIINTQILSQFHGHLNRTNF